MSMIVVAATFAVHASPAQATTQTAPNVTPATLTVTAGQTFHDAALAPDGTWFVGTDTGLLAFPRTQAGGLGTSPAPVTWSDPVTSTSRSVADAVAVRPDGRQIAVAFAPSPNDTAIIAVYDLPLSDAAPVRVLRGPSSGALEDIRSMAWDADGNLYALGWIYDSPTWWWGVSVFAPSTGENDPPARIIGERRTWRWSAITVDGSRDLIIGHATTFDGLASGYLRVPLGLEAQDPVDRLAGPVGRFVTTAGGTLFNLSGATLTAWDAGARWTQAPLLTVSGMPTGTFSALGVPSTGSSVEVLTYSGTTLTRSTYPITASGDPNASIVLPASTPTAPAVTLGTITGEPRTGARLQVAVSSATGSPEPSGIITWQSATSTSGPWTTIDGVSGSWYEPSASDAGKYLRASLTLTNTEGSADATSTPVGPIRPAVAGSRTQLFDPHATAVDSRGRVYVANNERAVTVHAQAGNVAPVAVLDAPTGATNPLGLSIDSQDRVWVAFNNCTIARYPALGASPAVRIASDRSWHVPLLRAHPDGPRGGGCRGVVPITDGSAFWASNADAGTLGRFSATGPSGDLEPDRILGGLHNANDGQGPWGLTLDPAGNVVVAGNGNRVLAVTPSAGFTPGENQTSADWAAWDEGWMAWQIIGLENAQAAVRRADGSTVIVAQGSPSIPFLQVLAPGATNATQPTLSLTTTPALPFERTAGFSVSADGSTAIVPSRANSAMILPISLTDGSVPTTWLQGSAVGQSGGYLRSIALSPSEPEPSPSPSSPAEPPATTPSTPATVPSPTVADTAGTGATAQGPAPAVTPPATSGAAPSALPNTTTQTPRVETSSSTSPRTAPVVRKLSRTPLALVIDDFPSGSAVKTTVRRPDGSAVNGRARVGAGGKLRLPTMRLSRPGRYLVTLTDSASGTRRYVAIVVQRPGRG